MINWFDSHVLYWHWVVFGLVLSVLEIFIPSFFLLWLGVSAITVGIILSIIAISFNTQLLIWMFLSITCLIAWFKFISPRIKTKSHSGMAQESILGKTATVVEHNKINGHGRVQFSIPVLGEEQWETLSEDALLPGDRVKVAEIIGNKLVINKL